jgi:transcription elongation factor GreA
VSLFVADTNIIPHKKGPDIMETQDVFLTEDGRQHAVSQLEFLRTVKRAEVAQYLHEAKESGDVIDNAAYEDAKNEQARLEGRILELEQMLANARLIDKRPRGEISLGSHVHLRTADAREYHYTIVGAYEARPAQGLISNESPVGQALLGHKAGDLVMASTPVGVKEYTILKVD